MSTYDSSAYGPALAALADPTRRRIYDEIRARPRSVGEIAATVPVSRPAVSQHLRVLREAGLVDVEQVGTRRVHRARVDGLAALRTYVEGLWGDVLAAYAAHADASAQDASTQGAEDD